MDEGTLYVARFDENGTGVWLPLTPEAVAQDGRTLGSIFGDLSDIILNTRGAADAMGATPMDRPEWCAVSPLNGDVYFTLTNNTRRTEANAANPRIDNDYGHIIRWSEADDMSGFEWDIFVFGSNDSASAEINRSGLTDLNEFASPDGLGFDSRGILWIQTDNGSDVADDTNDQVLGVVPSNVVDAEGNQTTITAENQEMLKRFFVGPNGCEVTGLAFNPDNTAMFVNIQHPGNWPYSADATEVTPAGTSVRPRASTVVIQKADGGPIGV
ncbi:alkaline phosphatase PhoX [Marinobacterium litorale]|uniref:alkaline phosphatase PhoX n=1 Tax=Marinobacterium litorale TaxID=404770 RepID=UPI0003F4DE7E